MCAWKRAAIGAALVLLCLSTTQAVLFRTNPSHAQASLVAHRSAIEASSVSTLIDVAITSLMHGNATTRLADVIANATRAMDLDDALSGAKLPSDMTSVLASRAEPVKLDKDAVDKAVATLNDKIQKAQVRLDLKHIEWDEFKRKNRNAYTQVQTDLIRLSTELANLERMKVANLASTSNAEGDTTKTKEDEEGAFIAFMEEKNKDDPVLAMRKADLAVAEYMLELSRCKDSALLQGGSAYSLSSTGVEACTDGQGQMQFRFEDPRLDNSSTHFSTRGREMLRQVLGASTLGGGNLAAAAMLGATLGTADLDDGDDAGELSLLARQKSRETPVSVETKPSASKQANRCANTKPNCGVLHDTFSMLWGEMKDLVEDMTDKMTGDETKFNELDKAYKNQIDALAKKQGGLASTLGEITGQTNAATEEQAQKQKLAEKLQTAFEKERKEAKGIMKEILGTEICGTTKVRNELLKAALGLKDSEIVDCAVSKWTYGGCSVPCDDKLVGGTQQLMREIVVAKKGYGAACPRLSMTTKCSQFKCPVDCQLSDFSDYSKCTKVCGGGMQTRIRSLEVKPKNGGKSCEALQESRPCNSGSCDRDCALSDWQSWTPCSQACDGGVQKRRKKVTLPKRAEGTCPAWKSTQRFELRQCNAQKCIGDEVCVAKLDVVLALDGSGSVTGKGFEVLKTFALKVIDKLQSEAYGSEAVRVSIVQFGNGHLKDGVVSDAELVLPLSSDMGEAKDAIKKLTWQRGFTNMAQAILKAHVTLKSSSRRDASGLLLLITDGKPSFKRQTEMADQTTRKSANVVVVQVKNYPTKPDKDLMKSYVTKPIGANYVLVPGKKALKADFDGYATKVLVKMCPRAESPSVLNETATKFGFKLIREAQSCAMSGANTTAQASVSECAGFAKASAPWTTFEFSEPPAPSSALAAPMGNCTVFKDPCQEYMENSKVNVYGPPPSE